MMRIAYLLADHGIPVFGAKGASVHVRDLATALCELGHEVTIFCAKRGQQPAEVPFTVNKIQGPTAESSVVTDDDPLANRRAKERRYIEGAAVMAEAFLEAHRQQPFDAIYERYSLWSQAGVQASSESGLPLVVEVNAPLLQEQRSYRELALDDRAEAVEREVFTHAQAIVAVSSEVAAYTIERGASEERVVVLPNAVDPGVFSLKRTPERLPETQGRCVIAFAGSLKAWHGVDVLLDGFRELNRRVAGVHLLLIGDGPMRQWLEGYIHGAALQDKCTITGWVDHSRVADLIAGADIAVAPYPPLEHFYFSPLKLFEYLALGKPVVVSDIGQIGEILTDGDNGLLIPPGDVMALSDALEKLVVDEMLRSRIGQAAAEVGAEYTWQANARRVVELMRLASDREPADRRKLTEHK